MESMTGYAYREEGNDQFFFTVEIKTLNSKYLEAFCNIPRILKNEEFELTGMLREAFSRGKVELNIEINNWIETRPVSLNTETLKSYYHELSALHEELGVRAPLALDSLLRLEGVTQKEKTALSESSRESVYKTVREVINEVQEMRRKEGHALSKDIGALLEEFDNSVQRLKEMADENTGLKREQLKGRMEELGMGEADEQRMAMEISMLVDRIDINEELVRLDDHIAKFRAMMDEPGQVGKSLDFMAQELFREINTVGSKAANSEISHLVVDQKNRIDRIREQCRNIV
jgi:uncharacterized protein (TIGR00255 family)